MKLLELYVKNQPMVIDSIKGELIDAVETQDFEKIERIEDAMRMPALFPTDVKFKKSPREQQEFENMFQKVGETGRGRGKFQMKCKTPMSQSGLAQSLDCIMSALHLASTMDEYFPSRVLKQIQQG